VFAHLFSVFKMHGHDVVEIPLNAWYLQIFKTFLPHQRIYIQVTKLFLSLQIVDVRS
jgi:hypothetical protein